MIDNIKKIVTEDQDPRAIEKISEKLKNLLLSDEVVGYIAVQKKTIVTIFPDSIVLTNKRILLFKSKNLGLSMEFLDYDWANLAGTFVKEGILGSDFTFTTLSNSTHTVDYLPKSQARRLYTYAKEQLDKLKNPVMNPLQAQKAEMQREIVVEVMKPLEATHFAEFTPSSSDVIRDTEVEVSILKEKGIAHLSQDELFTKLHNYKKLLDNGLILQSEYDKLKAEILKHL
jgi:hypothetical protein